MLAIPGAEGMFSHIQAALVKAGLSNRIKVERSTRDKLRNWTWLAGDIPNRPTSIANMVRHLPSLWQATNAAKAGIGGVLFDLTKQAEPIVWRHPSPIKFNLAGLVMSTPEGALQT